MIDALDHDSLVRTLQTVGFCVAFVLVVRLRPWRWLVPLLRGSRRG